MRQIILDTETTGLNYNQGDRVIEIGCVEMVNRRLTKRHFHRYINPEREVGAGAQAIHGITDEFLADKPVFAAIAVEFLEFVKDAELIIHNAQFDVGFLDHEFKLTKLKLGKIINYCKILDTLTLARQKHPGQRNSLDALSKRYSINNFNRELHGALLDAEILAQVYLAMTGGQAALFDDIAHREANEKTESVVKISRDNSVPLEVVKPSQEEISAHEQFLQLLDKESGGNCKWQE
jgi:DNA polymerase III subunit epsilon